MVVRGRRGTRRWVDGESRAERERVEEGSEWRGEQGGGETEKSGWWGDANSRVVSECI